MGDINVNLAAPHSDNVSRLLTSITDLYGLHQLICEPTRVSKASSTMIDLIFTNFPNGVVCSGVSHIDISDHSLVYAFRKLSIGLSTKWHSFVSYRKFKNLNTSNFRSDICLGDWDSINSFDDMNIMWRAWKNTFSTVVDSQPLFA